MQKTRDIVSTRVLDLMARLRNVNLSMSSTYTALSAHLESAEEASATKPRLRLWLHAHVRAILPDTAQDVFVPWARPPSRKVGHAVSQVAQRIDAVVREPSLFVVIRWRNHGVVALQCNFGDVSMPCHHRRNRLQARIHRLVRCVPTVSLSTACRCRVCAHKRVRRYDTHSVSVDGCFKVQRVTHRRGRDGNLPNLQTSLVLPSVAADAVASFATHIGGRGKASTRAERVSAARCGGVWKATIDADVTDPEVGATGGHGAASSVAGIVALVCEHTVTLGMTDMPIGERYLQRSTPLSFRLFTVWLAGLLCRSHCCIASGLTTTATFLLATMTLLVNSRCDMGVCPHGIEVPP